MLSKKTSTKKLGSFSTEGLSESEIKDKLLGRAEKKTANAGGRPKDERVSAKQAKQFLLKNHPKLLEQMYNMAMGKPVECTCPACGNKFEAENYYRGGDKELIMHIDNRVQGKPTTVTQIDATLRVELENPQLISIWNKVRELCASTLEDVSKIKIIEAEVTNPPEYIDRIIKTNSSDTKYMPPMLPSPDLMGDVSSPSVDREEIDKLSKDIEDGYVNVSSM